MGVTAEGTLRVSRVEFLLKTESGYLRVFLKKIGFFVPKKNSSSCPQLVRVLALSIQEAAEDIV